MLLMTLPKCLKFLCSFPIPGSQLLIYLTPYLEAWNWKLVIFKCPELNPFDERYSDYYNSVRWLGMYRDSPAYY
jgi:hypothetical protein